MTPVLPVNAFFLWCWCQLIFSTTAPDPTTRKPTPKLVSECPEGTIFSYTRTGSADQGTLEQWIDMVATKYPDLADENKKRIVIKIDGGPALPLDPDWLDGMRARGIIIYPGLPNGSGVNQVSACGVCVCVCVMLFISGLILKCTKIVACLLSLFPSRSALVVSPCALFRPTTTPQEMDQCYNLFKSSLAAERDLMMQERLQHNVVARRVHRAAAAGEPVEKLKLRPENAFADKDMGRIISSAFPVAFDALHLNSAAFNVGAYPDVRSDTHAKDQVQLSADDPVRKKIGDDNKRFHHLFAANHLPLVFSLPDYWETGPMATGLITVNPSPTAWTFRTTGKWLVNLCCVSARWTG
jgi:hypothetical protein